MKARSDHQSIIFIQAVAIVIVLVVIPAPPATSGTQTESMLFDHLSVCGEALPVLTKYFPPGEHVKEAMESGRMTMESTSDETVLFKVSPKEFGLDRVYEDMVPDELGIFVFEGQILSVAYRFPFESQADIQEAYSKIKTRMTGEFGEPPITPDSNVSVWLTDSFKFAVKTDEQQGCIVFSCFCSDLLSGVPAGDGPAAETKER